jgi:choline dehydrogenase-like flavoprotein
MLSSTETETPPVEDDSKTSLFDYIICGGGTAGCVIAARLAAETTATVLLIEAGRDASESPDALVPGKFVHQLFGGDSDGIWAMPSVPQKQLNDREIVFLRGKQLGGTSAVNYMALARGPAADYDEWARRTGDEAWKWSSILPLMKELEDFRPQPPKGFDQYADPDPTKHGVGGPLKIGFGDVMTPGVERFFHACHETGIGFCPDNNSGNPVGVGLAQFNNAGGIRSYAANRFLDREKQQKLPNLQILTRTLVNKIIFCDDTTPRAVGVEVTDQRSGRISRLGCRQEVIMCQGTFGSPQTLMLSGIGPREHLQSFNIDCVVDKPQVGSNMLDHSILTLEYLVDDDNVAHNQIFETPELLAEADAMYAKDKTGPHNVFGTSGVVAFPKLEGLFESSEFHDLDEVTQAYMLEPTRPNAEIWLGSGPVAFQGDARSVYMHHELLLQNNLSRGTVRLKSADARDLPEIDPHFFEHPYDQRIAIETVKQAMRIGKAAAYKSYICEVVHGPSRDDDETVREFIRSHLGQGYHSMGTCRMGSRGDTEAVVDQDFRVIGVQDLRVADLSVCPVLTCNHTQINVYLIGEIAARKLVQSFHSRGGGGHGGRL